MRGNVVRYGTVPGDGCMGGLSSATTAFPCIIGLRVRVHMSVLVMAGTLQKSDTIVLELELLDLGP